MWRGDPGLLAALRMEDLTLGLVIGFLAWTTLTAIVAYLSFFRVYLFKWKTLSSCPFLISPKEVLGPQG